METNRATQRATVTYLIVTEIVVVIGMMDLGEARTGMGLIIMETIVGIGMEYMDSWMVGTMRDLFMGTAGSLRLLRG